MKILRSKLFSKKKKEKDEIRELIKAGAIRSAVPIAISQVATRIDDKVAKRNHEKEVKNINEQAKKLKKEASDLAKDRIRRRESEYPEGLGPKKNKLKLSRFKSNVKEALKVHHKQIDDVTNQRMKLEGDFLGTKLKGNKNIRKLGVALAAVPAGLTVARVAAMKSEKKKKQEQRKKEGGK